MVALTTSGSFMKKNEIKQKPKIVVIVGPTASGKSDLAVRLAKKFNGEVISADSRQVYTGLNIGSGKITKREMLGVKHHLLDVASPKKTFTVSQYKKLAEKAIKQIIQKKKLSIIVGGTGFYVQSIVDDLVLPAVKPNQKLRQELEKKAVAELYQILKNLDPIRAGNIDIHNPRRLIRAIEIAKTIGQVPAFKKASAKYDFLMIGFNPPTDSLKRKIKIRLKTRLKAGLIKEVKSLHDKKGMSWKRLEALGLEYRFVSQYLIGQMSKAEMITTLNKEINHYAKRQMTWFKKDKRIHWLTNKEQPTKLIKDFLARL